MRIHLVGAGGIAMSGVAGLLKESGYVLQGSDKNSPYPPSSMVLKKIGLQIKPFSEENIRYFSPDVLIVGNSIKADNPEIKYAQGQKLPIFSFPAFLERYILPSKKVLVCAGTHGKTTTTSLLAHTLEFLKEDPSYLIGGVLKETGLNFRKGNSSWMILEGDEYPSAFFDPLPKFLHYKPFAVLLTSLEYDHADVYSDLNALKSSFARLLKLIPENGFLVYCEEDSCLTELVSSLSLKCKVISYGINKGITRLIESETKFSEATFLQKIKCHLPGKGEFFYSLCLPGKYNALNSLGVLTLLSELGINPKEIIKAFKKFKGVKRRQEIVLIKENLVIIDDFAHHPTAVDYTMKEIRKAFPNEWRLSVLFEPRTNSSKKRIFQNAYLSVLSKADYIYLKIPPGLNNLPEEERIELNLIKISLEKIGKKVCLFEKPSELKWLSEGKTVLLCMSSASLDKEIEALKRLSENEERTN